MLPIPLVVFFNPNNKSSGHKCKQWEVKNPDFLNLYWSIKGFSSLLNQYVVTKSFLILQSKLKYLYRIGQQVSNL